MGKEERTNDKGGNTMTLLARPQNKMMTIDKGKTKKFLEDSKKNTIKPDFLEKCLEFAKLMRGNSK